MTTSATCPFRRVFPLVTDYPYGMTHAPSVAVHQFGSGNVRARSAA